MRLHFVGVVSLGHAGNLATNRSGLVLTCLARGPHGILCAPTLGSVAFAADVLQDDRATSAFVITVVAGVTPGGRELRRSNPDCWNHTRHNVTGLRLATTVQACPL